jgi:hypothetical protein
MSFPPHPQTGIGDRGESLEVRDPRRPVTRQFSSFRPLRISELSGVYFPISCNIWLHANELVREPDLSPSLDALRDGHPGPPAGWIAH